MSRVDALATFAMVTALALPAAAERPLSPVALEAIQRIASQTGRMPDIISVQQDGRPSSVVGDLSRPLPGEPVEIAKQFITANGELFGVSLEALKLTKALPNAVGRTVQFNQIHQGVPVVGADAVLVVRNDGVVRTVSSSLVDLSGLDVTSEVTDVEAAINALEGAPWHVPRNLEGFHARLVVVAFPGSGRLAWELHFGAIPAFLSNVWAYVDAKTGELIRYENRIVFAYRGLAYETNPGPSTDRKEPIEVDFLIPDGGFEYTEPEYPAELVNSVQTACDFDAGAADCPGDDAVWLRHPFYMSRNCVDYHELMDLDLGFGNMKVHMCSEVQSLAADEDGNFFADDWKNDAGVFYDLNPNDKFAEVQMFYHVEVVYNYFLDLMDDYDGTNSAAADWPGHDTKPMMATVNYKLPIKMIGNSPDLSNLQGAADPYGELYNFDNAFFMAGGSGMGIPGLDRPFDTIVFGQGSSGDFSWDGDVVYHEFGHSIENSVSPGVGAYTEFGDEWGVNVELGGMSEGYADAFAGFITNEPTMGEYSLNVTGAISATRDMAGDDVCPDYFVGEVHYDSPGWSQSMYQAREKAVEAAAGTYDEAEAKHRFEQAAFIGLSSVVQNQGFGEAAAATLAAVEDLMGTNIKEAAAEAYAEHNTDGCPRFLADEGSGTVTHAEGFLGVALPASVNGVQGKPYTPSIVQYKVTVGDGVAAVNFETLVNPSQTGMGFGSGVPRVRVLVRHDNPIQFTYDFQADADENVLVDDDVMGFYLPQTEGKVNQGGQVVTFSMVGEGGANLPAGEYYLMPVNVGAARGQMNNIEVSAGPALANEEGTVEYGSESNIPAGDADTDTDTDADTDEDAGTDSDSDTDTDTDTDTEGDAGTDDDDDGSCGCTTPGRGTDTSLLVSLLGLYNI